MLSLENNRKSTWYRTLNISWGCLQPTAAKASDMKPHTSTLISLNLNHFQLFGKGQMIIS